MGNCVSRSNLNGNCSNTAYCEPCGHFKIKQIATEWCITCNNGLCEKCLKSHNEELSSHRIISIYHSNECDHHQIVSFFCPSHGQELCVTCRIQHHTKCHNVFPINKYNASIILMTTIPAGPNGDITSDVVTNVKNGMDCHIRHVLNESLDIISDNYGSQTSLSEEHQRPTKISKDLRNNKSKQEKKHESIAQTATETLRLKFLSMKEKH